MISTGAGQFTWPSGWRARTWSFRLRQSCLRAHCPARPRSPDYRREANVTCSPLILPSATGVFRDCARELLKLLHDHHGPPAALPRARDRSRNDPEQHGAPRTRAVRDGLGVIRHPIRIVNVFETIRLPGFSARNLTRSFIMFCGSRNSAMTEASEMSAAYMSPWTNWAFPRHADAGSSARRLESATMSGLYSTPSARAPRLAAAMTLRPSPEPRS